VSGWIFACGFKFSECSPAFYLFCFENGERRIIVCDALILSACLLVLLPRFVSHSLLVVDCCDFSSLLLEPYLSGTSTAAHVQWGDCVSFLIRSLRGEVFPVGLYHGCCAVTINKIVCESNC
jgi:hypothetical protein